MKLTEKQLILLIEQACEILGGSLINSDYLDEKIKDVMEISRLAINLDALCIEYMALLEKNHEQTT